MSYILLVSLVTYYWYIAMSSAEGEAPGRSSPRLRMLREDRLRQLLDVAWLLIRSDGTEELSLGRLAERAGVTKPVVYDHFQTRAGLLAALYQDFDAKQASLMDAALQQLKPELSDAARVIASSYVDCVLTQGNEIPGVIAALVGSPELEKIKMQYEAVFLAKCRSVLLPYAGGGEISHASLRAMLGAAEALSHAAAAGEIEAWQATDELFKTIVSMVDRATL